MVAVSALTPLTTPALLIVAAALLHDQVPPATLSDNVVAVPMQIVLVPLIIDAGRFTITLAALDVVPHAFVIL